MLLFARPRITSVLASGPPRSWDRMAASILPTDLIHIRLRSMPACHVRSGMGPAGGGWGGSQWIVMAPRLAPGGGFSDLLLLAFMFPVPHKRCCPSLFFIAVLMQYGQPSFSQASIQQEVYSTSLYTFFMMQCTLYILPELQQLGESLHTDQVFQRMNDKGTLIH